MSETGSGRLFALKKIRCHSAEDEKKALDEITYHRQIQHPSIIQCLGSVTIGRADISNNQTSLVLLLLPFYKLGTLQNLLETRQRTKDHLEENLVLDYFHKTCEGVQAIHKNGTAHRDLKPANVLLSSNNCIVIMDFGSMATARVEIKTYSDAQKLQDDAAERCSMTYRAPELFCVKNPSTIDEKIDIWSLGCLLYALCFFRSPYDDVYERGDSVALACSSGNLHIPPTPCFHSSLIDLIKSMLTLDPHQRPSIDEVILSVESLKDSSSLTRNNSECL